MSDSLRIAFVIHKYPPFIGGAERQASFLASLLKPRVTECHVFTSQPDAKRNGAASVFGLGTFHGNGWKHLTNFAIAAAYFAVKGHKYSVVQGYALSGLSCGAILGAQLRGCKTVVRLCSIGEHGDISRLLQNTMGHTVWESIARKSMFIAPDVTVCSELIDHGVSREQIAVIPNATFLPEDPPERAASRQQLGLPEKPTVLFAGRFVREKGIHLLQSAWETLTNEATLLLTGDGPKAEELERWAASFENVRFLGAQQDMSRYYSASDIFISPSASETFGNALAEAMSYGLAVITTPVGLARHFIRHQQNGLIINADSSELASSMQQLLSDELLRRRLGSAAREEVSRNFSPNRITEKYLELYKALIGGKSYAGIEAL